VSFCSYNKIQLLKIYMLNKISPTIYGPTNLEDAIGNIQRIASVIGLKSSCEKRYRELHANVWPTVLKQLELAHIQNYSIYITELNGEKYLFSYFEYIGTNLNSDLNRMANNSEIQRWWRETDICQIPLPSKLPDENWTRLEQVFFTG
jgi:L-rhamnose mutarotase